MVPDTPLSLRNRLIYLEANGHKQRHIANALEIYRMTVHRRLKIFETKGSVRKQAKKKIFTFQDKNHI
jgi:DNA-binding transcriptional regulator LsrR (DeoR family)